MIVYDLHNNWNVSTRTSRAQLLVKMETKFDINDYRVLKYQYYVYVHLLKTL